MRAVALSALAALSALLAPGCRRSPPPGAEKPDAPDGPAGTPVRVVAVKHARLAEVVSGPGRTVALVQQKVRAPFAGTLVELLVTDGDTVSAGQKVATLVSRESEAALAGARDMIREAREGAERRDAERAVALAEANLVRAPLLAGTGGMVLSHAANGGDRVAEDQEILTIAGADSLIFQVDVAQDDLMRVHPGQRAVVDAVGRPQPFTGSVHGVLGTANPADLTVPVRVDLVPRPPRLPVGLFGTAHITVGERADAAVLPAAAILRDDVSGVSRVATVTAEGRAHWVEVKTGLEDGDRVEVLSPDLGEARVITSGQVGLPEGAPVVVQP